MYVLLCRTSHVLVNMENYMHSGHVASRSCLGGYCRSESVFSLNLDEQSFHRNLIAKLVPFLTATSMSAIISPHNSQSNVSSSFLSHSEVNGSMLHICLRPIDVCDHRNQVFFFCFQVTMFSG